MCSSLSTGCVCLCLRLTLDSSHINMQRCVRVCVCNGKLNKSLLTEISSLVMTEHYATLRQASRLSLFSS